MIALWVVSALAFAWRRTPFDDEWFSIELARSDGAHFWRALAADLHPPWIAWLDRAVLQHVPSLHALQGLRIAVSAAALAVTAPWLARRLTLAPAWLWVAAFHPIVFMYTGSVRWYPFLLLAHALRARALWGFDRSWQRSVAFVSGALVGAAAGYIDAWFLLHDCAWWPLQARTRAVAHDATRAGRIATAGLAVSLSLALHALSPLGFLHAVSAGAARLSLRAPVTWAALALGGEAAPPWPWPLLLGLDLVVGIALLRGLWLGLREPASRVLAAYLVSITCAWLVATQLGIWHPRYSLWPVLAVTSAACAWLGRGLLPRGLLLATFCVWSLAFAETWIQRGFYKADLNRVSADDCARLRSLPARALVIVPYQGLADIAERRCGIRNRLLRVPSIRIVPDPAEQLRSLTLAFDRSTIEVVTLRVENHASLEQTDARVHAWLAARCRREEQRAFGAIPHRDLKLALGTRPPPTRFSFERWYCPPREVR